MLTTLVVAIVGCSSAPRPTVSITQTSDVVPFSAAPSTGVPVNYRLDVTNPLDHSVTLTAVEIESVGESGGYMMQRVRHTFDRVIPAHATATIELRAWVRPLQATDTGQMVSPVMLRGMARFESLGTTLQTAFAGRARQ